jgi:hypothetical protein
MKQADNNEVDLLLRALARARNESSLPTAGTAGEEILAEHLDADELNSYAEGVLPAAARLRYSKHLADCDACRGIVVGLTRAAGASSHEVLERKDRFGFWRKLGAILSPTVMRYAVPALVLIAVVAIGLSSFRLLSTRLRPESALIAQNEPVSPADQGRTKALPSAATVETPQANAKVAQSPAPSDSLLSRNEIPEKQTAGVQPAARSVAADSGLVAPAKDASKAGGIGGLYDLRPTYAPEPGAAPPSPAETKTGETDSLRFANEQPANRAEAERRRDETARNQVGEEQEPNRAAAPGSSGAPLAAGRVFGQATNNRGLDKQAKKSKADDSETRSVSGHQFAREGNTWVDSAYDSSRATTNVARGSEQFRALVADEPGLGAIAQELHGTVIVVWKNRAYRIQ